MSASTNSFHNLYYPPGGILLWIIILVELLTFGVALIIFTHLGQEQRVLFHQSCQHVSVAIGSINTIILLSSGFLMAQAIHYFRKEDNRKCSMFILGAISGGGLFLILKIVEYTDKISAGYLLSTNTFFTFYWFLTTFHALHVLTGMIILGIIYFQLTQNKSSREDVEAAAVFWHLCDLIWLLIFPVIYLMY